MIFKVPGVAYAAHLLRRLYDWMSHFPHRWYGVFILGLFFFIEAIFIFPAAGPLFILFCSERPKNSFYYATIATTASVLGGMVGYYVGFYIWEFAGHTLISLFTTEQKFNYLCSQYQTHEAWAILLAGVTPLPYNVITLTGGFCRISFLPFVICSIIIRSARIFLTGTVMYIWGENIKDHIDRYFNKLVMIFLAILFITLLVISS